MTIQPVAPPHLLTVRSTSGSGRSSSATASWWRGGCWCLRVRWPTTSTPSSKRLTSSGRTSRTASRSSRTWTSTSNWRRPTHRAPSDDPTW